MSNFKVNTENFLGMQADSSRERLYSLALSHPDRYFALREKVISSMRNQIVEQFYTIIYNGLTTGTDLRNQKIDDLFTPCLPDQEVNKFAINCAASIRAMCQSAVEKVLPADFKALANQRGADAARALGTFDA
jgi:spore maturation protein CgeB